MKKTITIFALIISLLISSMGFSAEPRKASDLYYTYVGPIAGFGMHNTWHKDWFDSKTETKSFSGLYTSGGALLNICVNNVIGDFRILYTYNTGSEYNLMHMTYEISAKYAWKINETFKFTAGLGMFFHSPPSNKDYNSSAGVELPLGTIIKTTESTRLLFDIVCQFGSYGLGEDSLKLSYGLNIGFMFKVGRI